VAIGSFAGQVVTPGEAAEVQVRGMPGALAEQAGSTPNQAHISAKTIGNAK